MRRTARASQLIPRFILVALLLLQVAGSLPWTAANSGVAAGGQPATAAAAVAQAAGSITARKVNDLTGAPIAGWTMRLHSGWGCEGAALASGSTDASGQVVFGGLSAGRYSVAEEDRAGWTAVSGLCQDVTLLAEPTSTPTLVPPTGTRTGTPAATVTSTPANTATNTATSTATGTAASSVTNTPTNTSTGTATGTATSTTTSTPVNTATSTPTNTPASTSTNAPASTATSTPTNTSTSTASSTATSTPTNTSTSTATGTSTNTPTNTATSTATSTVTATETSTATSTATNKPTNTSTSTATNTATSTATDTATSTATSTSTSTATATATSTPSATATVVTCTVPDTWEFRDQLPFLARGPGVTGDDQYVYAAGGAFMGEESWQAHDGFARYDPAAGTWETLTPMPRAREGVTLVYAPNTDKIYAFGGQAYDGDAYPGDSIQIYDIATETWDDEQTLPDDRAFMAGAYSGGKIYLLGGANRDGDAQSTLWEYDPVTGSFDPTLAPYATDVAAAAMEAIGGRLYVAGGYSDSDPALNLTNSYDIAGDSWTPGDPLPAELYGMGSAVLFGQMWVYGGNQAEGFTNATYIYDPGTGDWSTGPSLNVSRGLLGGAALDDVAYAVGGETESDSEIIALDATEATGCKAGLKPGAAKNGAAARTLQSGPAATGDDVMLTFRNRPQATPTATATATATATPPATATPCAISFSDVPAGYWARDYIYFLYCRGHVSGYDDGTFRPEAQAIRGQVAKILVNVTGTRLELPPGAPHFADVPPADGFYLFVETAYGQGWISGYDDGKFRPYDNVTRAQLSKMIVLAAGWNLLNPPGPSFVDVAPGYWAYRHIETAAARGVVHGYNCDVPPPVGGPPCKEFRPELMTTRAQLSKMVVRAFTTVGR